MPVDLKSQIRDYVGTFAEGIKPVTVGEIKRLAGADDEPRFVSSPRRRGLPGWAMAIAAAAAVLVLVGGLAWLLPTSDDLTEDSTPTTTPAVTDTSLATDSEPVTGLPEPVVIGPGSWSVAANVTASTTEDLNSIAADVLTWDGVFEVAIARDDETWLELTGFTDCPVDGAPSCGEGLVVLVAEPWMSQVALRLENELGMRAVAATEVVVEFWEAYVGAVTSAEPPELTFDPSTLGRELTLARATELEDEFFPPSMTVELGIDGLRLQARVSTFGEYPGQLILDPPGAGFGPAALHPNGNGQGGILFDIRNATDEDSPGGPRRLYVLGALPLDAAIVATNLADGTPVWQRPVDGMALIVDDAGSVPDGWHGGELVAANPLIVLDAAGNEIIRIEGVAEDPGFATDLRLSPITTRTGASLSQGSNFAGIHIANLGGNIPGRYWAEDRIAFAGGAIWVATNGALYRLDPMTAEITDRIETNSGVGDLLVDGDMLWVIDGNWDLLRLNARTGELSETVKLPCVPVDCFAQLRNDLLRLGDDLWFTGDRFGPLRVDPTTGGVERFPSTEQHIAMWLGQADGLIWALGSHDGHLRGLDPSTSEWVDYQMHEIARVDAHESWATLVGDEIWLVPCCDPRVVRFDTVTRETSTVAFSGGFHGVAADGLWIAGETRVERIDTEAGILTDSLVIEGLAPRAIIADDSGAIWVSGGDVVIRIDGATRQITDVVEVASGGQLLAVNDVIWVAGEDGTVTRIEAG